MSELIVRDDRGRYPMLCILFGHRWFKRVGLQGAYRHGQCHRCEDVDPPKWMVQRDPEAMWEPRVLHALGRLSASDGIPRDEPFGKGD